MTVRTPTLTRGARRRRLRRELAEIKCTIAREYAADPESTRFADREHLYMRHHRLTRELEAL